jgi:uncharacterized protein (TIGR02246 family)
MHRKMPATLVLVLALVFATPARPADPATEVNQALDALNQAFEKGDAKAVAALMTDDHIAVAPYYSKPLSREEQLKGLADHKLVEYKSSKMKVQVLGPDAALVTYEVAMKGTFKGKPVPAKSFASAIWVRKGGKWQESFYQETPLPD